MIHNLYIISEGGTAIYSKNFAKSTLDEQLISGFLLAIGNFAKEAVGSGLKKIEMQTGDQLHVYYDNSLKLTAAAIAGKEDHPKLLAEILKEILKQYDKIFPDRTQTATLLSKSSKFDTVVTDLLKDNTAKRNKTMFILGLLVGALLLGFLFWLFLPSLRVAIETFISRIKGLVVGPSSYFAPIHFFGIFSMQLELILIVCFIPSSLLAGFLAGSRNKGKWIGVIFFFFAMSLSAITALFQQIGFLFVFMLLIYIPLVLITSITLGYLGGLLRDRSKLYPVPLEIQI